MVSRRSEDLTLRLAGALSSSAAYGSARFLFQTAPHASGPPHGLLPYGLALVTFLCASAGAALLTFGRQLKQRVVVSDRWATPADFRQWSADRRREGEHGTR